MIDYSELLSEEASQELGRECCEDNGRNNAIFLRRIQEAFLGPNHVHCAEREYRVPMYAAIDIREVLKMGTVIDQDSASNSNAKVTAKKQDGRLLRSERSRQLIIDATKALVNEGILIPTAQNVADRAGVGIRTVFRHFADMETLYFAMDSQLRDSYEKLFEGGDREGALSERIRQAVERRATAYEKYSPLMLSTRALMWRSPTLKKNVARNQKGLRKDLASWLPETTSLDSVKRETIDAAASFETWNRLRQHQGLSKKASMDVVCEIISLALGAKRSG